VTAAQRLTFLAIGAVIAIVAVVVLLTTTGGGDEGTRVAASPTATAAPAGGGSGRTERATVTPAPRPRPPLLVQGSPRTLRFTEGQTIRFRVRANRDDEVHVHGYDRLKDVAAGQTVTFAFPASITGIFEVELEQAGVQLGSLRVDPR